MPKIGKAQAKEAKYLAGLAEVTQMANMERLLKTCKKNRELTMALAQLACSSEFKKSVRGSTTDDAKTPEKFIPASKTYLSAIAKDFFRWTLIGMDDCFRNPHWSARFKANAQLAVQVWMFLTGEARKSKPFTRDGFEFTAGYRGVAKANEARLKLCAGSTDDDPFDFSSKKGVFEIVGEQVKYIGTDVSVKLPAVCSKPEEWEIKDNYNEYEAFFWHKSDRVKKLVHECLGKDVFVVPSPDDLKKHMAENMCDVAAAYGCSQNRKDAKASAAGNKRQGAQEEDKSSDEGEDATDDEDAEEQAGNPAFTPTPKKTRRRV